MEGFQINYTDLSDLFWEYKRKIENLIENIDNCIEKNQYVYGKCSIYRKNRRRSKELS